MRVTVKTPCRLHFCLIDMNGSIGRVNGSIGLALNYPNFILEARPSNKLRVLGKPSELVEKAASIFYKRIKTRDRSTLKVISTIPRHVGLGSATQALLGVGTLLSRIHGKDLNTLKLARIMGRGGTSGIGVYVHQFGGFILDGGHDIRIKDIENIFVPSSISESPPPPMLFRYNFPKEWKFVVAIPNVIKGSHGSREVSVFKEQCPVPSNDVGDICRIILMKLLPALLEQDINEFGIGLSALQNLGFAKTTQDLMHPTVKKSLKFMMDNGAYGAGQSSFGPTTYGLIKGERKAERLCMMVKDYLKEFGGGNVFYSESNNSGVEVKIDD